MEEKKEGCEHGDCKKCKDSKCGMCGRHMCFGGHCHHMMKVFIPLILIAAAVCFGFFMGSHFGGFERGNFRQMMNYGYVQKSSDLNGESGSVTVKVLPQASVGTTTP